MGFDLMGFGVMTIRLNGIRHNGRTRGQGTARRGYKSTDKINMEELVYLFMGVINRNQDYKILRRGCHYTLFLYK